MGIEIERKFLVNPEKWDMLDKPAGTMIRQGYLLNDETRTVRVRVAGVKAYLTIKGPGTSAMSRKEFEYEIPLADGEELLSEFATKGPEKTRYRLPNGAFTWEVDVFSGDNMGLIVAEIELKHEDDAFDLPNWVTKEVTEDERYANSSLSEHPFLYWK